MTKEEIIEKVKQHMQSINLEYEKGIGIYCRDKEFKKLRIRDGSPREVYVVSFKTPDRIKYNAKGEIISLVEGTSHYCYIAADTYEILYYLTEHGYIEPDGTFFYP